MRKGRVFLIAVALLAPAIASAGTIANTKHDLSATSTAAIKSGSQTDTCVFCHVSHNSAPGVARPLWSHTLTNQNLTWAPTTTVRGTVLPTSITSAALTGSRACMSCHDGTVALGDLLNGTGGTVTGPNVTAGKLSGGVNLINPAAMQSNHPIGVAKPAAATGFTSFKTVPSSSPVNYDSAGYVQCGSCHNPHDNTFAPFLKIDPASGAICTSCHDI
ncbi:MAG: cytochrome c3 family protein [Deltaproteobacteria bacterium]|nr:cytochrome c3 family protein [Deltaproteobacteria bacterium]